MSKQTLNVDKLILPGDELLTRQTRRAPCEQRLLEHLAFLRSIEIQDERAFWVALGQICLKDYWAYLRFILKYRWCDPFFHGEEIARFVQENQTTPICILMPRGSGKTSAITQPLPAWKIAQSPLNTVVINNAREDKAQNMARAAAAIIASNKLYQTCYPEVRPSDKWSAIGGFRVTAAGEVEGSAERIDATISCYGVGGNITGSHANALMLHDDLINRKMVEAGSRIELNKAREHLIESFNCVDAGTQVVVCGTRWLYTDFYGEIEAGDIQANDGKFKVLKFGIYRPNGDLIWPQRTFIDLSGREQKAGYTTQQIEAAQKRDRYFAALYMNQPMLDQDVKFDISMIKFFDGIQDLPFRELGNIQAIGIECESQGNAFLANVKETARRQHRTFRIDKLTTKRVDKTIRILNFLQKPIANGLFNMRKDIWTARDKLGEELRTFDKGNDDCLDACAHFIENVKEDAPGQAPRVYIAVDPAFTTGRQSDHTAVIVGVLYRGEYYILDNRRYKTDKTDHLINLIFQIADEYTGTGGNTQNKRTNCVAGFQSIGYSKPRGRGFNLRETPFIIESPYLLRKDK